MFVVDGLAQGADERQAGRPCSSVSASYTAIPWAPAWPKYIAMSARLSKVCVVTAVLGSRATADTPSDLQGDACAARSGGTRPNCGPGP